MKKLDKLLLKSFIGPFLITFIISVFLLVMQFLWVYIDDLLGKGVEFKYIFQLIILWGAQFIPLAMPLAILLSSIMTFGNFGESMELTAIKASGISLKRFAVPLLISIIFLSFALFYFQSSIAPKFNRDAFAILHDIRNKKPAFNIKENIFFNELDGYSIKVNRKGDNNMLYQIMIYDHTSHQGINNLIYADKGHMYVDEKRDALIFELFDGYRMEENLNLWNKKYDHQMAHFDFWKLAFDQSQFNLKRIDKEAFDNNPQVMTNHQIRTYLKRIDSNINNSGHMLMQDINFNLHTFDQFITQNNQGTQVALPNSPAFNDIQISVSSPSIIGKIGNKKKLDSIKNHSPSLAGNTPQTYSPSSTVSDTLVSSTPVKPVSYPLAKSNYSPFLKSMDSENVNTIASRALGKIRMVQSSLALNYSNLKIYNLQKIEGILELQRKYAMSAGCIILFIIGASLGSIIRKGGLGLPILFAISFFIVYYVLIIFGEKFAKQEKLPAEIAMWISFILLSPVAYILLRKAINDSPLLNKDYYTGVIRQIKKRISKPIINK